MIVLLRRTLRTINIFEHAFARKIGTKKTITWFSLQLSY